MKITAVNAKRVGVIRHARVVVSIEVDGQWLEVISEPIDSNFDTTVNESGLQSLLEAEV